jgi:hypothetical protein
VSSRRVAEFVFRRRSVPIFLLLAGVVAVISAIAAGSVTWKVIDVVFCVSGEASDVGSAVRGRFEQLDAALRQSRFYAWLKSAAVTPDILDEHSSLASAAADVLDAVQTQFRFFAGFSGRSWPYGQLP